MAYNDIEVEIKITVSEEEFLRIKNQVKIISKFEKIDKQSDEYFNLAHRSFLDFEYPYEWLSIRKRGGKTVLNYKHWYPENSPHFSHCDEFSCNIDNEEKLKKIFAATGFKNLITVDKTRETYNYKDEFEVALDIIEELGYFIEIEALKDFGTVDETRKNIFKFAEMLGINSNNRVNRGYPYLLMKKRGLIK